MNNRVYMVLPVGDATSGLLRKAVHSSGGLRLSIDKTQAIVKFANPGRKRRADVVLPTAVKTIARLTHAEAKALMSTAAWTTPEA